MGKRTGLLVACVAMATTSLVPARPAAGDEPGPSPRCTRLAVIGDSLTVGSAPYLRDALATLGIHDFAIDAERGRHIRSTALKSGVRALRALRAKGFAPDCAVVALGTNDIMMNVGVDRYRTWADEMLREIGDLPVLWVDVAFARLDTRALAFNEALATLQADHPQLLVAAWREHAAAHPEWLAIDKLHLRRAGYVERGQWLAQRILDDLYLAAPPDDPPACTITRRLRVGARHDEVVCLETRLERFGFTMPGGPDRTFDRATYRAVARLQRWHWLAPSGIVGPTTLAALGWAVPS